MATRLGVDVGGTFTDLIFYDDQSGEVRVAKEPTTPVAPEEGVGNAVATAVPGGLIRSARYFLHGTTVGLNSLLERKGAKVGLLATRGFRDILEVRRGDRDDPYDLVWKQPPPLVPRHLRIPITERMLATGAVLTPLDESDIRHAAEVFKEEEVTSVAVAFLHAYANPEHELAAERALRASGFNGTISLSHQISGEHREYERTTTTVIDAYVHPRMSTYLQQLDEKLAEVGFDGELLVTRSGGGAMTFSEAELRPFETVMSGPVAGAEGAAELARNLQLGDVITADVGGTSFDTCLITGGRPQVLYEGSIVGLPVQTSWVDVRSIGAGGGSVAYVDAGGLLKVGPESAGSAPGPACYGRGGTQPTVTDAAFILGMLGEGKLASGMQLDRAAAYAAIEPLARQLRFSIEDTARGVLTIVNANMANAIREITVEQGQDPRQATLLPFGGAGPLFGTLLARELDIEHIVIPPYAGNFSAWGLLGADLMQSAARTRIMKLHAGVIPEGNGILSDLFSTLISRTNTSPDDTPGDKDSQTREIALDMRYVGQEHTITVSLPSTSTGNISASVIEIQDAFTREYERTFGHTMDEEIEIVSFRATIRTPLPRRSEENSVRPDDLREQVAHELEAFSFTQARRLPFQIVDRARLLTGATVKGPAIILEETATTYLDADFHAVVHPSGALFLHTVGGSV